MSQLDQPLIGISHSCSGSLTPCENIDSNLETVLTSRFQFSSELQRTQTQTNLLKGYVEYLERSRNLATPLSLEQFTDQIFIPYLQRQSRTAEEVFTQEVEEPIGKTIQALYSFVLSHPISTRDHEKSGFDFWLAQFFRVEQSKAQVVYGALKGGYFTALRPLLELAFSTIDVMKRQHRDLTTFPKIQQQIEGSNEQFIKHWASYPCAQTIRVNYNLI